MLAHFYFEDTRNIEMADSSVWEQIWLKANCDAI